MSALDIATVVIAALVIAAIWGQVARGRKERRLPIVKFGMLGGMLVMAVP